MAQRAITDFNISIRVSCNAFGISETCYRYKAKLSDENAEIADWLLRVSCKYKRWGFGLCFLYLRNIKGYRWNHKRVYRIYRDLELNRPGLTRHPASSKNNSFHTPSVTGHYCYHAA